MIEAFRNHAVEVLLGIAVRIFEDAVVHPHGQRCDVAGRNDHLYSRIKSRDQGGLSPAPAGSGDIYSVRINLWASEQIVHSADAIPDFPARQIRAGEIGQVAHYRVLGADQVVATLLLLRIPK